MILVTGASGTTGSELVRLLSSRGLRVRALLRNPQKRLKLEAPEVTFVQGDLAQPETLQEAIAGVQKVFLLSSPDPEQVKMQGNLIRAAVKAGGVRHVVKMSALGASTDSPVPLGRWHAETERELEASGLPFTHLRPHFFMQNLFLHAQTIALEGQMRAPMGGAKISIVDARDVAEVAAAVLTGDGHEGMAYDITGPEALSFAQMAEKIGAAAGIDVRYVDVPLDEARQQMLDAGAPEWFADSMTELYRVFRAGHGASVTSVVQAATGRRPRSFDEFAREHSHKFRERG
jgi:uncharacterized protein YbjT (DUF2867 family)